MSNRRSGGRPPEACVHPVWREKVIRWYFSVVSALDRQQRSPSSPFNRSSVHVSTALFDSYILALPSELSLRYKHDRAAYQLLATSCLLIGMRLTLHDQQALPSGSKSSRGNDPPTCQLKRAKTHRDHMDQADHQNVDVGAGNGTPSQSRPHTGSGTTVVIPTAATILQMSAAPKTISESKILTMVREVTRSRAFPRSHVITALDYIRALSSSTQVENTDVTLTPAVADEAYRFADIALTDVTLIGCRPSVVASASITLALSRAHHNGSHDNMVSLREDVCTALVGEDRAFQVAVRQVEEKLIAAAAHRATHGNAPRQMEMNLPLVHHVTAHLIPQEEF
eukprot:scaffold32524_cov183-Skeletonema_menzelii.AAC.1